MRSGLTGAFEQMTWRDATVIYDEGGSHHEMVVGCYVFDSGAGTGTAWTVKDLHRWIGDRLGTADFFTSRVRRAPLDIDHPTLVPAPDLDLSDHVHLHKINGGWRPLRDAIAGIASRRIDLALPPWELHALTGATDVLGLDEATVLVLKVHHCAADGMELRRIEAALFSEAPGPGPLPSRRPALAIETALRALARAPRILTRFARAVRAPSSRGKEHMRPDGGKDLVAPARDRPATRFNQPTSGRLTFDVGEFRLDDIRAARSAVAGATINDVLLTIVGGALHRLLEGWGEGPDASLAAMVPISLRLPDTRTGNSRGIDCVGVSANQLVLGTVRLHTDIPEPVARLEAVMQSSHAEKTRWTDPQTRVAESRMAVAPAWLLSLRATMHRLSPPTADPLRSRNTMISNLPAPSGEHTLEGAPLLSAFGVLPVVDGDRLRHLFTTCGDRILLSVSADSEAMADIQGYVALIRAELSELSS